MKLILQNNRIVGTATDDYTGPDSWAQAPEGYSPAIAYVVQGDVVSLPPAPTLDQLKAAKNDQINLWRAQANQTNFPHAGKVIACDALSRSDIDGVAGSIALNGDFPANFPGAWKAVDNTYVMLPDVAAFKALYASMTAQGTANFANSQARKETLAAALTAQGVADIVW